MRRGRRPRRTTEAAAKVEQARWSWVMLSTGARRLSAGSARPRALTGIKPVSARWPGDPTTSAAIGLILVKALPGDARVLSYSQPAADCHDVTAAADGMSAIHGIGVPMKALVYQGPGKKALEDRPKPEIQAPGRRHRQNGQDHHLRHRPAYPEGRRRHLRARTHSRPRGRRRGRCRGPRRDGVSSRRPGADLLHLGLRQMRLLPARHVFALHDRRLDPRQRDRRDPGRIRPHPPRRHQPLSDPRRRRRGGAGHAQRHPADRLRVRRAQRQGLARARPWRSSAPARSAWPPC